MTDDHIYQMSSELVRDKIVAIEIHGKPKLEVSTPVDFWPEAPKELISPEDLFVASALSCYGVSLSGAARRFHAELTSFRMGAVGTLKKGERGWEFDKIRINASIEVPTEKDQKRMEKAAERAETYCLITNSMKCPVEVEYDICVTFGHNRTT